MFNERYQISDSHSSRGCGTWFLIQGEWSSIKLMVRLGCQWFRISKALLFSVWNIEEDKSQKWSLQILYNRAVSISVSGLQNGWPGWDLDAHLSLLSIDWQFYGTSFSCICWYLNIHVAVDKADERSILTETRDVCTTLMPPLPCKHPQKK